MDTEPNPELVNRQPKWFKPVFHGCIVASILFVVAGLMSPLVGLGRSRKITDQSEATNNARIIGLALFEFEREYSTFPSDTTAALVTKKYPAHGYDLSGSYSNSQFRQFFAAELTYAEATFYAKTKGSRRPDGITTPGKALGKGEVGFSYITGLSSSDAPLTPILLTPLIPGTTTFDPKPFDGKAVILHIDGSVTSMPIANDGHIYDKGIDLLSPKHPVWKGKAPDIRYPE